MIHLQVGLSGVEGEMFLGGLGVEKMDGDMEIIDVDFECRD